MPRLNSYERNGFVSAVAEQGNDAALAARLSAFVTARIGAQGSETAGRARSMILYRDRVRREGLPQVGAWLAERDAR
jgi:hypothetical protein